MPTYQVTLPCGTKLKTVAPSPKKARSNFAHRLSLTHGHRKAYTMLGPVTKVRLETFTPRYVPATLPKARRVPQAEYTQGVLSL